MNVITHDRASIDAAIKENLNGRSANVYLLQPFGDPLRLYHVRTRAKRLEVQVLSTGKWIRVDSDHLIYSN